jgi:hypothetical protein
MCSSHCTGCERTCEARSKISAHFGFSYLKLRKVPTVPWDGPFARKTESPFRNVSTWKRLGDWRVWNRSIFIPSFLAGDIRDGRFGGPEEQLFHSALGGRCHHHYSTFRACFSDLLAQRASAQGPERTASPLGPWPRDVILLAAGTKLAARSFWDQGSRNIWPQTASKSASGKWRRRRHEPPNRLVVNSRHAPENSQRSAASKALLSGSYSPRSALSFS